MYNTFNTNPYPPQSAQYPSQPAPQSPTRRQFRSASDIDPEIARQRERDQMFRASQAPYPQFFNPHQGAAQAPPLPRLSSASEAAAEWGRGMYGGAQPLDYMGGFYAPPPPDPPSPDEVPASPPPMTYAQTRTPTPPENRNALTKIHALRAEHANLRASFSFPPTLDYVLSTTTPNAKLLVTLSTNDMPHPTVIAPYDASLSLNREGKLAFTPTNAPLHGHVEALNQLLLQLDGVDSAGEESVRNARREAVQLIEGELKAIEQRWMSIWTKTVRSASLGE
jgi:hypothetical protein